VSHHHPPRGTRAPHGDSGHRHHLSASTKAPRLIAHLLDQRLSPTREAYRPDRKLHGPLSVTPTRTMRTTLRAPRPDPATPSGEGVVLRPARRSRAGGGLVTGSTDGSPRTRVRRPAFAVGSAILTAVVLRSRFRLPFHSEEEVGSRRIPGCSNEQPTRAPLT
jgi:hypothetical protein